MRNPINSILAQVLKLQELTENLEGIIDSGQLTNVKETKRSLKKVLMGY